VRRLLVLAVLGTIALPAAAGASDARYRLAGGCYELRGAKVRLQASALGRYLLYTADRRFLSGPDLQPVDAPGPTADFAVSGEPGSFALQPQEGPAPEGTFALAPAEGCATFPEADSDVDGRVSRGRSPWQAVRGLIDSHFHWMAIDMFGGDAHCGRPWSPYGVAAALVDCPDHAPGRPGLAFENVLSGNSPGATHDLVGWPTFKDWPRPTSLTHENTYYRWVERAYRGGLRLAVVLFFDNAQLCGAWPERAHDCDEMASVRREIALLEDLRDYIDAQAGGPGRGWMRIVRSPFEARRAINAGKLAVVMGIETSRLFDCRVLNGVPGCTKESLDRSLRAARAAGIRSLEITGKFDNALAGVAGDPGTNGIVTNQGNRLETGSYLRMKTCSGLPSGAVDKPQMSAFPAAPPFGEGATPVYPPPPHCNQLGLSDLGRHLINRMADTHTILDPDHMAAIARIQALDIMRARRYSGIISSHSWSTPVDEPRILRMGGVVFPKAAAIGQASTTDWFVGEYHRLRRLRVPRYRWGFGYGSDSNGVAKQPTARAGANVSYPFPSYDGRQTVQQMTTGERRWDYNRDGVANYGLYLDWLQELRQRLGPPFVRDMLRGPEAYLEMWERAYGVPRREHTRRARVGMTVRRLLMRAGQPRLRRPRVWVYTDRTRVRLSRRGRVARVVHPLPINRR
jgi:microsomal dipeptidase-like Zn-dependent dipeptidase